MRLASTLFAFTALATSALACRDILLVDDGEDGEDSTSSSSSSGTTEPSSTGAGIPTNDDPDKHGFPDDVYAILQTNCVVCHTNPPQNGAPVSFEYYADTQKAYYTTGLRWWSQIREHAILNVPLSMPYNLPPLPQAQKDVLAAWIATCGPDDTVPELCAKGTGTLADPDE